jgi:pimeloyl-ACP methyl ester carboxylesterase
VDGARKGEQMMHVFLIAVAIVALVVIGGAAVQSYATRRDERKNPPPGELVDIGGHRLHLFERGEGSPTIVFESGLMATVLTWNDALPDLSRNNRVVCYDRAGLGWSDPGPLPRTAGVIADELRQLLTVSGNNPPFVLVGHSFGGLTMMQFAARHAEEVAGLVLIDPVMPAEWNPPSEQDRKRMETGSKLLGRAAIFAHLGWIRFVAFVIRNSSKTLGSAFIKIFSKGAPKEDQKTSSPLFWNLPQRERDMARVFWVQPKFCATISSQLENLPQSAREIPLSGALDGKPLVVISAKTTPPARLEEHIRTAQRSTRGKHLIAERSGHWIMIDEPRLVIGAIQEIVKEASIPKGGE